MENNETFTAEVTIDRSKLGKISAGSDLRNIINLITNTVHTECCGGSTHINLENGSFEFLCHRCYTYRYVNASDKIRILLIRFILGSEEKISLPGSWSQKAAVSCLEEKEKLISINLVKK